MFQTICIAGSDKRLDYLSDYLKKQGFCINRSTEFDESCLENAGLLIGPPSFHLKGKLLPEIDDVCRRHKVPVLNYLTSEEFLLQNASLTAEGFLSVLIADTPFSLQEARILLLGLGRCGKALLSLFQRLQLRVDALDCPPIPSENLTYYNVVINTIPAPVLSRAFLCRLDPACILFDIATWPGGYDQEAATALKMTLIHCPGLPGKTCPKSAGHAIGDAALAYLN